LAVRLFIGNLPYGASEADLRAHFSAVAEPSHIVMPVDRETGRPRGFAFVEFAERAAAEEVIKRFDAQAVSGAQPCRERSARARGSPAATSGRVQSASPPAAASADRRVLGRLQRRRWRGFGASPRRRLWWASARRRRLRRTASWRRRVRWTSRARRTRSQRQLRPARAAETLARRQEGRRAAGEQAARPIKERSGGRIYAWTISRTTRPVEIDDLATSAKDTDVDVETDIDTAADTDEKGEE
jgi:hypothetical protein